MRPSNFWKMKCKMKIVSISRIKVLYISCSIIIALIFSTNIVFGIGSISELQSKINARNSDIQNLLKEIDNYQKQITALNEQASSLSVTIKSLDLTQKKLAADISVTESKIDAKNLEIEQMNNEIGDKEDSIVDDRRVISQSFSIINQNEDKTLIEILLSSQSISDTFNSIDQINAIEGEIIKRIEDLKSAKAKIEVNKTISEKAKSELLALNKDLKEQRQIVLETQNEKNKILKETKQSESAYQTMLSQKQKLKDSFEKELVDYEAQLKIAIDLSKLPDTGKSILSYPLDKIRITQYFGNTPFATANPQVYNGAGHTGIDFAASIGTPVKSAAGGIVIGTGNTDAVKTCYSYGKWVMIKHENGLSTLYAHLSTISVVFGDTVGTGDRIGYSGNTGYTTGPHLHFGVYASQGVQIKALTSSKNCRNVIMPIASFNAYLNPLSYL